MVIQNFSIFKNSCLCFRQNLKFQLKGVASLSSYFITEKFRLHWCVCQIKLFTTFPHTKRDWTCVRDAHFLHHLRHTAEHNTSPFAAHVYYSVCAHRDKILECILLNSLPWASVTSAPLKLAAPAAQLNTHTAQEQIMR
jgi:hypothetical protein